MELLTNNFIANMKGPDFLQFYGIIIVTAMAMGWYLIRSGDSSGAETTLPPPANPDPYDLAYLRGGAQEVIRLAIFRLVQARRLTVSNYKDRKISQSGGPPGQLAMSDIERMVYDDLASPQTVTCVCKQISSKLKEHLTGLEWRLKKDHLLADQSLKDRARLIGMALYAVIFGLGGYKLVVALSRGRSNVVFLVIMTLVGFFIAIKVSRAPHLTKRGKQYLKDLQTKHEFEKEAPGGLDGENLAVLVGLFGFGALAGTVYSEFLPVLTPPSSYSSSDSSGGCSGGGSDSGGGCGGCGGGGD